MPGKITTIQVRSLLRDKWKDTRQFAVAEEVGNSTGYEQKRRLDMVVVDCFKSNGFSIHGIEIKVSKSDLRRELQDSSKHNIFFPNLDYFSLAAPTSVVDIKLIPEKWGIYLIDQYEDGSLSLRTYRKPLSLHDEIVESIDRCFAVCLMRALYNQSPSNAELAKVKEEALREARIEFDTNLYVRRAERAEKELEAFEELKDRLHVWGAWDIEQTISEFEQFRNLRPSKVLRSLERIAEITKEEIKRVKKVCRDDEEKGGDDANH